MRLLLFFFLFLSISNIHAQEFNLQIESKNGKYGYIDYDSKEVIIPFIYDFAYEFNSNGFAVVLKDSLLGVINEKGEIILPIEYEHFRGIFNDKNKWSYSFYYKVDFVQKNKKWGTINKDLKVNIPVIYDSIVIFNSTWEVYKDLEQRKFEPQKRKLFKVKLNNHWGIIDENNKEILPLQYEEITGIPIAKNYRPHILPQNLKPDTLISFNRKSHKRRFPYTLNEKKGNYLEDIFMVKKEGKVSLVKEKGELIFNQFQARTPEIFNLKGILNTKVIVLQKENKFGMIALNGKIIIPFEYDFIGLNYANFFCIEKQGKYGIANHLGEIIQEPIFDEITGQLVTIEKKQGVLSSTLNKYLIPPRFDEVKHYSKSKFSQIPTSLYVINNKKYGLVDLNNQMILPTIYEKLSRYRKDYFLVTMNGNRKIINKDGTDYLSGNFESIKYMKGWPNGLKVKTEKHYGVMDFDSKEWKITPKYEEINYWGHLLFKIKKDSLWGIIDVFENIILPIEYDEINRKKIRIGSKWGFLDHLAKIKTPVIFDEILNKNIVKKGNYWGMIDNEGDWVLSPEYDKISGHLDYANIYKGDKVGIFSHKDSFLMSPKYESVEKLGDSFYLIKENRKWAVIDLQEIIIIPFDSHYVRVLLDKYFLVSKNRTISIYDLTGEKLLPDQFTKIQEIRCQNKNAIIVYKKNKKGLLDENLNWILNCKYQDVNQELIFPTKNIDQYLFPVKKNNKWGYVFKGDKIGIPFQYDMANSFHQDFAIVKQGNQDFLIDTKGNLIHQKGYDELSVINRNKFIVARLNDKSGVLNLKGEVIIPFKYESIKRAMVGYGFEVMLDGKYGILNNKNKFIIPMIHPLPIRYYHLGIMNFKTESGVKHCTINGIPLLKNNRSGKLDFCKGYAKVIENKKEGIINLLTDEVIIPITYHEIRYVTSKAKLDYLVVKKSKHGKYGLIDSSNNSILPFEFDNISRIQKSDLAFVKKRNKFALINFKKEYLTDFEFDKIDHRSYEPFAVKKQDQWGFIDKKGKVVIPFKFEKACGFQPFRKNGYWFPTHEYLQQLNSDTLSLPKETNLLSIVNTKDGKMMMKLDGSLTNYPTANWKIIGSNFTLVGDRKSGYGLVENQKNTILKTENKSIYKLQNGFIPFAKNDIRQGFYFPRNKKTILATCVQVLDNDFLNIRWIKNENQYQFINNLGELVSPFYFSKIGKRQEGLQAVIKDGKIGFLDDSGKIAIPFKFDADFSVKIPFVFQDGISIAYVNGKYGFIDKNGITVIPFIYEAISYFNNKVAIVFKDGKWEQLDL